MTHELTKWIRRHPISVILILVIWYLSLFTPPKIELANVRFIDKWAHLLMYGSLAFILWTEDWRARKTFTSMPRALALYIGPVAMSGLIELAQAYCTTNRTGDWLDLGRQCHRCIVRYCPRMFRHPPTPEKRPSVKRNRWP